MKEQDVVTLFGNHAPTGHPAWKGFLVEVRGVAYGYEALLNAWAWYRDGYLRGVKDQIEREEIKATDRWCDEQ